MVMLHCIRPGLWRSDNGRWEAEQRDLMDVATRDWVLRHDGDVIDGPVGIDWPTLTSIREYITAEEPPRILPLRRLGYGVWGSRCGRWTFMRHQSDPHPQRWYAYEEDDDSPSNDGLGHTSLWEVVEWAVAERDRERAS